jgi:amidase
MSTPFPEYTRHDALGLAELVRTRQVSPAELVETAIAHIEVINPRLNAVIHHMHDAARAVAAGPLPAGPFAGVPFLLKDLVSVVTGVPCSSGSRAAHGLVPDHDSHLVERFRAAGLVFLGKTNTPEFGLMPITEPALFGPTHNPWDPSRTSGGSSGGSAAAVAARVVPVASGGDGGGSLRVPASACGVVGLKPSRGRNPLGPDRGQVWGGLVVEHVLARSVRDTAAMLDATAGPDRGAPYHAPPPVRPFLDEVGAAPGRLRIAYTTRSLLGTQVAAECVDATTRTARLLADLGHHVEEAAPAVDRMPVALAFVLLICVDVAADLDEFAAQRGRAVAGLVEPGTRAMDLIGRNARAHELEAAVRVLHRATREVAAFFERHDILLTPTLPTLPLPTGALQPTRAELGLLRTMNAMRAGSLYRRLGVLEKMASKVMEQIGFTALFNVTGQPAVSLPLAWSPDGLPIGMQLAARYGDEAMLLRLAAQLEEAQPWADRRPPVCAA